jgi:hypothetical protein
MKNRGLLKLEVEKLLDPKYSNLKGLSKIGSGKNRIAYKIMDDSYGSDVKGKVLKVDFDIENEMEVEAWEHYNSTNIKKYLVPIREYAEDYSWIIMDYGKPIEGSLVSDDIYKTLTEFGTDITGDDFVRHNGREKCCDYASML